MIGAYEDDNPLLIIKFLGELRCATPMSVRCYELLKRIDFVVLSLVYKSKTEIVPLFWFATTSHNTVRISSPY